MTGGNGPGGDAAPSPLLTAASQRHTARHAQRPVRRRRTAVCRRRSTSAACGSRGRTRRRASRTGSGPSRNTRSRCGCRRRTRRTPRGGATRWRSSSCTGCPAGRRRSGRPSRTTGRAKRRPSPCPASDRSPPTCSSRSTCRTGGRTPASPSPADDLFHVFESADLGLMIRWSWQRGDLPGHPLYTPLCNALRLIPGQWATDPIPFPDDLFRAGGAEDAGRRRGAGGVGGGDRARRTRRRRSTCGRTRRSSGRSSGSGWPGSTRQTITAPGSPARSR